MSPAVAAAAQTKRRLSEDEILAFQAFMVAHATLLRALEVDLDEHGGLTVPGYGVLHQLFRSPERRLRLSELAELVFLTKSGLSRLLDRLEERGYIERRACENDKRGQYAVLTAEGRRAYVRASPIHLRGIARLFSDKMSAAERELVTRVLRRLEVATP